MTWKYRTLMDIMSQGKRVKIHTRSGMWFQGDINNVSESTVVLRMSNSIVKIDLEAIEAVET